MKKPIARPVTAPKSPEANTASRPRAFTPQSTSDTPIRNLEDVEADAENFMPPPRRRSIIWRVFAVATGLLIALGLSLAAERLVRALFNRYEWLGWIGLGGVGVLVLALAIIALHEVLAIMRLRQLDKVRAQASAVLNADDIKGGKRVVATLQTLYADRPDMARPRRDLDDAAAGLLDGSTLVETAEHALMTPLDKRVRALTTASARRVAIVTAISPRALVDVAFVAYESLRLARAIADLYGARPGLIGSWRLAGAILSHLAVTGGVALGDSVVQQLLGHGLAAKLSARLGEGLVNGLMTVRVGIAAMRVVRPLPFSALKQPVVMDFMADLAKITSRTDKG